MWSNNMKNKTLAFFGIGTCILSVIASATDIEGNSVAPIALLVVSGIATTVFIVMAIIRLWKEAKSATILLAFTTIIFFILSLIQGVASLSYGRSLIIQLNITKVINFIAFFWVIIKLFKMK
ncbi:MAG: hypothetical protein CVU54_14725 [Deltaproteobacteria bacterium HGW-Deltaproteobacteria-12]|jgi:hypothetical protein|nr:MAG: hypothetical protein CVU54_14725 [Deltaproteobacteria bacterium HGW-Deltaproteobacteria-12]